MVEFLKEFFVAQKKSRESGIEKNDVRKGIPSVIYADSFYGPDFGGGGESRGMLTGVCLLKGREARKHCRHHST